MCLLAATLAALMTGACSAPGDTSAPTVAAQPDAAAPSAVDAAATAAGATVDLSSELEALRKTHGLPALAGAVYRDGALVGAGAAGVRKLGDPTAVTSSDVWHLGSCTKAMTATLVGLLVEEGKLSWTDKIATLLPDAVVDPSFASATVEMLLQHIAGFAEDIPPALFDDMWAAAERAEAPEVTRKRVVYATLAKPAGVPVGSFAYSNTGYMAAGVVLERATGKSWETLMKERLFAPLGMNRCGFGPAATAPATVDQPWAHFEESGKLVAVAPDVYGDNPRSMGPAGTVHCPLEDWAKFLNAHLEGPKGRSKLASAATFQRLQTPPKGGTYAAGWDVGTRPWAGGTTLSHSGSNTMNLVTTWIAPAKGLVMMVATNAATSGADLAVDAAFAPMVERFGK